MDSTKMVIDGFTPTEKKIFELLSDGLPHSRREVHACLWDEQSALSSIQAHVSYLRGKVRDDGLDIICELFKGRICYRMIRPLSEVKTCL